MQPVRNSAKAVIIRDGRLLVTVNRDDDGDFCLLPGGGQRSGEPLAEALRRECREEIGVDVIVGELRYVREYIGGHHEFAAWDGDVHQIEYMFVCRLADGAEPAGGHEPDSMQVGVEWVPLDRLTATRLYPAALRPLLASGCADGPVYLGDVN
jgi:8-oxo-dGTP pyrophosphatase MutT (NUDIX family)